MEDRIEVGMIDTMPEMNEEFKIHLPDDKECFIMVDPWMKDITGLTPELIRSMRPFIEEFVKKTGALKLYCWGEDAGGVAAFGDDDQILVVAYDTMAGLEIDTQDQWPSTEDEYWNGVLGGSWF
jgi:hypothetical protein